MNALRQRINRTPLRQKLLLLFLCFGILPLVLVSIVFYSLFSDSLLQNTINNLSTEADKNNELIALRFERIEEASLFLTANADLRTLLNVPGQPSDLDTLHGNLAIKRILDNYFISIDSVFSYHLYTDYYMMAGNNTDRTVTGSKPAMYVPYDRFASSELYAAAAQAKGKLVWYPTYGFEEMYDVPEYRDIDYDYHHLFSAVKQINCLDTTQGRTAPVLIVSFKPEFIDDIVLSSDLPAKGARYYVASPDNEIIASSEKDAYGQLLPEEIIRLTDGPAGAMRVKNAKEDNLIVFNTLRPSGWKQIIIVPSRSYLGPMATLPNVILLVSLLLAAMLAVVVTVITRSISRNMTIVTDGMKELGIGHFGKSLPIPEDREFGLLAAGFNQMSDRIRRLILENYEIDLREKEAQLMALNLQMNPHFLYNTLSTINWIAIENGQDEISLALTHLCDMLQRSYKNKSDVFTVEDDLKWLEDYLYMMKLRFEDQFEVTVSIEEALMKTHIPRSMFQPLIENAIIHGFQNMDGAGQIRIEGNLLAGHARRFLVADNGAGFDPDQLDTIMASDSVGIGLSNLNHRLKVLYKDAYSLAIDTAPGEGTRITIILPPESL